MSRYNAVETKAIECGATSFTGGINWAWVHSFPNRENVDKFIKWLDDNNFEHRGAYSNDNGTYDVRYR